MTPASLRTKIWREKNRERAAATNRKFWASLTPQQRYERNRIQWLRKRYKLTPDDVQKKLDEQNGRCGICEKKVTFSSRTTHVDHCHATGKFRGILCHQCNVRLAAFDDTKYFNAALKYLERATQ